jgi:hypothetical protein
MGIGTNTLVSDLRTNFFPVNATKLEAASPTPTNEDFLVNSRLVIFRINISFNW